MFTTSVFLLLGVFVGVPRLGETLEDASEFGTGGYKFINVESA
jgi:hypothetical protein